MTHQDTSNTHDPSNTPNVAQGTRDPMREARYAAVIADPNATTPRGEHEHISSWTARAVLALVDAELEQLRDENELLRANLHHARAMTEAHFTLKQRAERERDALRAQVRRSNAAAQEWALRAVNAGKQVSAVRALADEWLTPTKDHLGRTRSWWEEEWYGEQVRVALSLSEPVTAGDPDVVRLSINLHATTAGALKGYAETNGVSVTEAVRRAVAVLVGASEPVTACPEREYPDKWDGGPHSRACGFRDHSHGRECHKNCPTCAGEVTPPAEQRADYCGSTRDFPAGTGICDREDGHPGQCLGWLDTDDQRSSLTRYTWPARPTTEGGQP